jgi:uncharacterized protein YkwD
MMIVVKVRRTAIAAAWSAIVLTFALLWMGIPDPAALAASPQTAAPATPSPSSPRATELGVWHHFGENQSKPSAETPPIGVWRHFGLGNNPPPPVHESPTRRTMAPSRTQELEQEMYELVNRDRGDPANAAETGGRAFTLRWNDRLAAVARAHSLDMLNQGYFGHEDRQGRSVAGRVEAAGIDWQAVGENIALFTSVAAAEAAFMNEPRFSKNHRANILNPNYTDVGIGIVQAADGRLYITQDFYAGPQHP